MNIERRNMLKSLAAMTAAAGIPAAASAAAAAPHKAPKRPNILVFLSDDHAQWLQQAYGNSEVLTPNMERVAQAGVKMTNAFTTCPVCSPARASFFTGGMPSQHGIHDWIDETMKVPVLPSLKGQILISDLLKHAGYNTSLVGKWHCGEEREPHSGFDYWYSYWVGQYPHRGVQNFSDNGTHESPEGFQSPMFTDRALQFLKTHYAEPRSAEQPFFLFVGYSDTHSPHIQMPDDLVSDYKDATFRDIPVEPFLKVHGTAVLKSPDTPEKNRIAREQYYAAASSIDREVGRILDDLKTRGVLEDTFVVYTADHGLNAGQHGIWEKGNATVPQNFFEESIRVPCAISWANGGVPKNLESGLIVNHCDLFATVLEVAQATPEAKVQQKLNSPGRSYLSQLRGNAGAEWRDSIIIEYGNARMIRKNGYKLILRYPYAGITFPPELYDMKADPRETTNIYEAPSSAKLISELTTQINEFYAIHTVPGHSGLDLEHQPVANPESPWLRAVKMKAAAGAA